MKLPFSLFLALRFLKPKRTFVSVITVISVLGVTLGIAVLIIVISVMTGFDRELQRKVLGFDAHLIVSNSELLRDWRQIDDEVRKAPGVVATAPFVQGPVIIEYGGRVLTPKIRGIEIEQELKLADLRSMIKEGTHEIQSDQCLIGMELADQLGVVLHDKLTVYAPRNIGQVLELIDRVRKDANDKAALDELKEVVLPAELEVVGVFESGRYQYDSEFVLVPLYVGQELYGLQDEVHGLSIRTTDPYHLDPTRNAVQAVLPSGTRIDSWMDMNRQFFEAVRMERNVMFVILFFIIIVAAFCVMNTLITVTVQKRRDIGVMKALGATPGQIIWVFLAQGMIVGILGNITGVGLGMIVVRWRNEFKEWLANVLHIEIFPPGIYQFSQIPAEVIPRDLALICISAFVICALAALIPAWNAARLDPVKALRYE
ncbi:MAG TPA: FtsX-like permease family protein [Chthoniobacteraceae bacterium]|nr:FtsX-like permease family protein [Chthoniobacteraceae bacterium]